MRLSLATLFELITQLQRRAHTRPQLAHIGCSRRATRHVHLINEERAAPAARMTRLAHRVRENMKPDPVVGTAGHPIWQRHFARAAAQKVREAPWTDNCER